MKKLFVLCFLCFNAGFVFSQTNSERRAQAMEDPKFKEFKKRHEDLVKQSQGVQPSEYFGYDETLKSYFTGNIIPKETPKATGTQTKKEYVELLNKWISNNKQHLKPEHKNSLITE